MWYSCCLAILHLLSHSFHVSSHFKEYTCLVVQRELSNPSQSLSFVLFSCQSSWQKLNGCLFSTQVHLFFSSKFHLRLYFIALSFSWAVVASKLKTVVARRRQGRKRGRKGKRKHPLIPASRSAFQAKRALEEEDLLQRRVLLNPWCSRMQFFQFEL